MVFSGIQKNITALVAIEAELQALPPKEQSWSPATEEYTDTCRE